MAQMVKKVKKAGENFKKTILTRAKRTLGKVKRPLSRKRKQLSLKAPGEHRAKDLAVAQAKYFTHLENRISAVEQPPLDFSVSPIQKQELPAHYDRDLIVLLVRDPWWLYSYWEVKAATYQKLKNELGPLFDTAQQALRVYDVSFINFNGSNAHRYFDIALAHPASSWYIDTGSPGRSWCVDLGLKLSDGRFITIVRSNIVTTPLDGPSWVTDEEWMVPEDLFVKLYTSAVGLGGSPVKIKKPWAEVQKRAFASGGISSGAISPVKQKQERKRKFWLVVNTELIVYGATEPDAKVTVSAQPITLRPDGTFSLRFSLPDGKQVIPVEGTSADGIDTITITPIVTKETK